MSDALLRVAILASLQNTTEERIETVESEIRRHIGTLESMPEKIAATRVAAQVGLLNHQRWFEIIQDPALLQAFYDEFHAYLDKDELRARYPEGPKRAVIDTHP